MGCQESEPADKSSNAKCFKDPMLAYKRNFQQQNSNNNKCQCQNSHLCKCKDNKESNKQNISNIAHTENQVKNSHKISQIHNDTPNSKQPNISQNQSFQLNKLNQKINEYSINKNKQLKNNDKYKKLVFHCQQRGGGQCESQMGHLPSQTQKTQRRTDNINVANSCLSKSRMLAYQCDFQQNQQKQNMQPIEPVKIIQQPPPSPKDKSPKKQARKPTIINKQSKTVQVNPPKKVDKKSKKKYPDPIKLQLRRVYDL